MNTIFIGIVLYFFIVVTLRMQASRGGYVIGLINQKSFNLANQGSDLPLIRVIHLSLYCMYVLVCLLFL